MFKAFQKGQQFKGFPALNFQMNNEAYGFSGCIYWIDASYGLDVNTNLAAISKLNPRIGAGTWTQTTAANQPRLVTNDANFNNNPVIDFYDFTRRLTIDSGVNIQLGKSCTVAWIARTNAVSGTTSINMLMGQTALSLNRGYCTGGTLSTVTGIGYMDENSKTAMTNVEDSSSHIVVMTSSNCIIDGTSRTYTVGSSTTFTFTWQQFGAGRNLTVSGFNGQVAEILVYNQILSSDQMIALSDNINTKYAIY